MLNFVSLYLLVVFGWRPCVSSNDVQSSLGMACVCAVELTVPHGTSLVASLSVCVGVSTHSLCVCGWLVGVVDVL